MNREQRNYMMAKATYDSIVAVHEEEEAKYLRHLGIVNPDGTIPERIWMIDDDAVFETVQQNRAESDREYDEVRNTARDALRRAEDELIAYALSIAPAGIRETLDRGAKTQVSVREKLLELAFHLDTRTVPR